MAEKDLSAAASPEPLLSVRGLAKAFPAVASGHARVELFRDLHLELKRREVLAITGESGAGKSTLLHLLAALDTPTSGEIWLSGTCADRLPPRAAAAFRNRTIGYLWQFHYLLPEFTTEENVAMPLLARGDSRRTALAAAADWLARVGLAGRERHRAGELSGGEQQRAALARALITQPQLLLADEPTGNLDAANAERVVALLLAVAREQQLAAVIVTHSAGLARCCDRALRLERGRLQSA